MDVCDALTSNPNHTWMFPDNPGIGLPERYRQRRVLRAFQSQQLELCHNRTFRIYINCFACGPTNVFAIAPWLSEHDA